MPTQGAEGAQGAEGPDDASLLTGEFEFPLAPAATYCAWLGTAAPAYGS